MPLPWVRLDANFYTNPKVLALLQEPRGAQAVVAWLSSLAYCGSHGTDGFLTRAALPFVHADAEIAALLTEEDREFWVEVPGGFEVHDWLEYQESNGETQARRKRSQLGAAKGNCIRWHGRDCGCWKNSVPRFTGTDSHPDRSPRIARTDGLTDGEPNDRR